MSKYKKNWEIVDMEGNVIDTCQSYATAMAIKKHHQLCSIDELEIRKIEE